MVKGSLWLTFCPFGSPDRHCLPGLGLGKVCVCVCVCVCVILYVVLLIGGVIVKPRLCFSFLEMKQKEPRGLRLR